jgi:hypothetical protein
MGLGMRTGTANRGRRADVAVVAMAVALLALPLATTSGDAARGLRHPAIELVILIGVGTGWLACDRLAAWQVGRWAIAAIVLGVAIGGWVVAWLVVFRTPGIGRNLATILAVALSAGGLIRGAASGRRSLSSLVAIAAVTTWLTYDVARVLFNPLRDFDLYLEAGRNALAGQLPYVTGSSAAGNSPAVLPFVYPPVTIPLFELFASLPRLFAHVSWLLILTGCALAGLWLLGVRGRWLPTVLLWPPLAIGISVGNVAIVGFVLFALGVRFGPALVVGGMFKPQSALPALWLVRERRWRDLMVGITIALGLVASSLLVTGLQPWSEWLQALGQFQEMSQQLPAIKGFSVTRWLPVTALIVAAVVAVGFAWLGRGRNGLARFGVASVVASPTLYIHGLAPLLPGVLVMSPALMWFVLGLGPWVGAGLSAWLAVALVAVRLWGADERLTVPADLDPNLADIHPAAAAGSVWPEPSDAGRLVSSAPATSESLP